MSINAPNFENFTVDRVQGGAGAWKNHGPRGMLAVAHAIFEEDRGSAAGVYTAYVDLPVDSVLVDIIIYNEVLWTAGTDADANFGDVSIADSATGFDVDGYFATGSVKATDLLAEQTWRLSGNLSTAGGEIGAYGNVGSNTHLTDLFYTSGGRIIGTITTTGTFAAPAGVTHMFVLYAVSAEPRYSTFVAT